MDLTVNTSVETVNIKNVTVTLENAIRGVGKAGETLHVMKVRQVARCESSVMKNICHDLHVTQLF